MSTQGVSLPWSVSTQGVRLSWSVSIQGVSLSWSVSTQGVSLSWSVADLPRDSTGEKASPLSQQASVQIASQLEMGLCVHLSSQC